MLHGITVMSKMLFIVIGLKCSSAPEKSNNPTQQVELHESKITDLSEFYPSDDDSDEEIKKKINKTLGYIDITFPNSILYNDEILPCFDQAFSYPYDIEKLTNMCTLNETMINIEKWVVKEDFTGEKNIYQEKSRRFMLFITNANLNLDIAHRTIKYKQKQNIDNSMNHNNLQIEISDTSDNKEVNQQSNNNDSCQVIESKEETFWFYRFTIDFLMDVSVCFNSLMNAKIVSLCHKRDARELTEEDITKITSRENKIYFLKKFEFLLLKALIVSGEHQKIKYIGCLKTAIFEVNKMKVILAHFQLSIFETPAEKNIRETVNAEMKEFVAAFSRRVYPHGIIPRRKD